MSIVIRADGDGRTGAGHVMRMLALAEHATAAGHAVTMLGIHVDDTLIGRVEQAGVPIERHDGKPGSEEDAELLHERARALGADWIVVDGYQFGPEYQRRLTSAGTSVLVVDDYGHNARYHATMILNQNMSAEPTLYATKVAADTRLLLGPTYAILRSEFASGRDARRDQRASATRVLVTMGGADPDNVTERMLDALTRVPIEGLEIRVLVGPSNRHLTALSRRTGRGLEVLPATSDVVVHMQWADLAISGAGTTSYELCCLGIPMMLVILAENQAPSATALDREGACVNLGWHHELDPNALAGDVTRMLADDALRSTMGERGRALVDGRGAARVLETMSSHQVTHDA